MTKFNYDGTPSVSRERVLEETALNVEEVTQEVTSEQEEIDTLFDEALAVHIFGQEYLKELSDLLNNQIDVPESAPEVRAAVLRQSNIPSGSYIDFALFRQAVETIFDALNLKQQDLIDFTGDPNTDTHTYKIKQRQNIGDDLTLLDLFLAGLIIPGAYIAARIAASQMIGTTDSTGFPIFGPLLGEAIALLFLLGLDSLAVKAELKKSKVNTKINGMSPEEFVDYLDQNPKEIHAVLENSGFKNTTKIEDFKIIKDFCLDYIFRTPTSAYDHWLTYYHVSSAQPFLERMIELSPRYSEKWKYISGENFDVKEFVKQGERALETALSAAPPAGPLRESIRQNLLGMQDAFRSSMFSAVAAIRTGYRNSIAVLLNDFLPFPDNLTLDSGLSIGNEPVGLTINLNKTLICCLLRIFAGFPPETLRLMSKILALGAINLQLNFRNIMGRYIQNLFNTYVLTVIGMVETVRTELLNQIFGVLGEDSEIIDLILACTPAKEILFQVFKQFNLLFDQLKRMLLDVTSTIDFTEESFQLWELNVPLKRTLLFIAELLEALAIELEFGGGVLCATRQSISTDSDDKNKTRILDSDLTKDFVEGFVSKNVPAHEFTPEFKQRYDAGKYLTIKGKKVLLENSENISNNAVNTLVNYCTEELSQERQVAAQTKIKEAIKSYQAKKNESSRN